MSHEAEPAPFVPRHGHVDDRRPPTPDELAAMRAACRAGAKAVHDSATGTDTRQQPTPTEELARARARADKRETNR